MTTNIQNILMKKYKILLLTKSIYRLITLSTQNGQLTLFHNCKTNTDYILCLFMLSFIGILKQVGPREIKKIENMNEFLE